SGVSMAKKRIYIVHDDGGHERAKREFIRASNPAQAIRHSVRGKFRVEVATTEHFAELAARGEKITVLDSGEDDDGDERAA
ncbi:MAG: hypothetical protein ACREM8_14090, partial [Vulcanimicrobiaceae bacterium]